jgi:RNA polymerase sigma factor (sigma-70 family)
MTSATTTHAPYLEHKSYVLAVLGRRCGWLDVADREALFHDAFAVMLEKHRDAELQLEEMHPQQIRAYLTQTALFKALDEGKRAERKRTAPLDEGALAQPDPDGAPDEIGLRDLDDARLREIVDELPARRQAIVKLRFFFDRTPAEIQGYLGISERGYRRDLERALKHIAKRFELVREGKFCASRRSLLLAYVSGIAGPNRAHEARSHLATCPGCMRWAVDMREAARHAAAVVPIPAVAGGHRHLARLVDVGGALRQQLADLAANLRHTAEGLALRADQSTTHYSTALRPGTVVAVVTGCVALGGGTYCAVDGLPAPVRAIAGRPHHTSKHQPRRERAAVKRSAPPAPATTTNAAPVQATIARRKRHKASTSSSSTASTSSRTSTAAAVTEFGVEGAGQTGAGSTSGSGAATPAKPAAPPAGGDEFGP